MKKVLLNGKTALITGASSGIGKATAMALASQGVNLILVSRGIEKLNEVQMALIPFNIKSIVLTGDITKEEEIGNIIQKAIVEFGVIDFLVCSAGIYYRCPAVDLSIDNIRKVIDTNFYGTLKSIYQILPHFRENYGGHIVVVSSFEGKRGLPMDAAYAASKQAITGFMEVFRQELYGTPIHVSTILPGRIDTPMIANIKSPKASPKFPPELVAKAIVKALRSKSKEILVPNIALKLFLVLGSLFPSFADWFTRHYKLQGEDVV